MKIRSIAFFSENALGSDAIRRELSGKLEGRIEFPFEISNNECSALRGAETSVVDSPLSFLLKFKASFAKPGNPSAAIMGIEVPENLFQNSSKRDDLGKFESVNAKHFDLLIKSDQELDQLVMQIQTNTYTYQRYDVSAIADYIKQSLGDPEWIAIFSNSKSWDKFKKKVLIAAFKKKHCQLLRNELIEYQSLNRADFETDLMFLSVENAVTDTEKLRLLKELFPKIFWRPSRQS